MNTAQNGRTTSADGVDIAYTETGSGPISLLFIHGGLASRAFWAPQLAALGGTFRMAALDLAGHGDSGRNNRDHWSNCGVRKAMCARPLKRSTCGTSC